MVTCVSSLNFHKNQAGSIIMPILQIGTERFSDLPRVTLLVMVWPGLKLRHLAPGLNAYLGHDSVYQHPFCYKLSPFSLRHLWKGRTICSSSPSHCPQRRGKAPPHPPPVFFLLQTALAQTIQVLPSAANECLCNSAMFSPGPVSSIKPGCWTR